MDKKKKIEYIPRPKEDIKIDKSEPKFNEVLSLFVNKNTTKPNDDKGNK